MRGQCGDRGDLGASSQFLCWDGKVSGVQSGSHIGLHRTLKLISLGRERKEQRCPNLLAHEKSLDCLIHRLSAKPQVSGLGICVSPAARAEQAIRSPGNDWRPVAALSLQRPGSGLHEALGASGSNETVTRAFAW